ncbi:MAG: class I SAM-dependent methyltransferase [Planctomycetes bacterium]|nr:class I SAM-dependent methyltransferase [Planctomycetota bacterium]
MADNAQAQIELHKALAPRYAYRYSFEFSRLFQDDWHAELLSHLPPGSRRVLDLGCGTGFFLAELDQKRPGAIGLDISHAMLRVSEQYVPGARLVTADAEKLPFRERSFDAIFCKGSLHHTRDHIGFLANCRRALSRDGVLIMSEPCNDNFLIRWARFLLYKFSPHFDLGDQGFTKEGLRELYESAGFEVTFAGRYGVFAYVLAGFPDHLGILRYVPGNVGLVKFFLKFDRWMCATRVLRIFAFQVVMVGKPKA